MEKCKKKNKNQKNKGRLMKKEGRKRERMKKKNGFSHLNNERKK